MSTTLTNGLKLPDKGSVDWYADMQNNYTILDGAVGTVAEHTTQIAGKAPAVHTHTKADITDLLNSNFIPSANNSYDLGSSSYQWNKIYSADVVHTSGDETITGIKTLVDYWRLQAKNLKAGEGETYGRTGYSVIYTDKNAATMGDVTLFKNANAARTFIRIRGGDYYTNGAPAATGTLVQSTLMVGTNVSGKKIIECDSDIVYPTTNNATDLGTSDKKWKSVYSDSYYYGTTAWGLDRENSWSKTNYFSYSLYQKVFTARASIPSSNEFGTFIISDFNTASVMSLNYANRATGVRDLSLRVYDYSGNANGVMINKDASNNYSFCSINPANTIELGTSTNKWKSLNGVNPGALSLPDAATTWEDITGYVLDGTTENRFPISGVTALDGWLQCRVKHTLGTASFLRMEMSYRVWTAQDKDCVEEYTLWVPVKAGASFNKVICLADDLKIRFHPCLGNV